MGDNGQIKIADFGVSDEFTGSDALLSDSAGTPAFLAPEMVDTENRQKECQGTSKFRFVTLSMGLFKKGNVSLPFFARPLKSSYKREISVFLLLRYRSPIACSMIISSNLFLFQGLDIWSMGVTLYCLIFGVCPFHDEFVLRLHNKIRQQPVVFPETISISDGLKVNELIELERQMVRGNQFLPALS